MPFKRAVRSIKTGMGVDTYNPTEALLDEDRIGRAIWECLKDGDAEGIIEQQLEAQSRPFRGG